jgi:hypothetical protein
VLWTLVINILQQFKLPILIFTFDMLEHCKTIVLLYILVHGVSSLVMTVKPKHVAANYE